MKSALFVTNHQYWQLAIGSHYVTWLEMCEVSDLSKILYADMKAEF